MFMYFNAGLSCMIEGVADGKTFIVQHYKAEEVCKIIDDYLKNSVLDPSEQQ